MAITSALSMINKKEAFIKAYKPMFHKQLGRPKKTRIRSAGEPSPSSNPKAKHLRQGTITKAKEDITLRQHINSENYKTIKAETSIIFYTIKAKTTNQSKAKKRTNHHQSSSQSNQAAQPSQQPAQPSQASLSNQAAQPSQASQFEQPSQASQFEQASQASEFEQASQAALFEQASQSQEPNSSRPLQASPQRKVRFKSPAKRKSFLEKFKPWRY
ncbi:uncharacterized protein Pyn_37218 [Prunus yedoensis var. nudiflora]|uniref:Uncharacterized protein n=1 Tax=Prunus yedoensis var. nudiflora TaxID=2094558 RepID=A0A314Z4K3_PRUYE|nr:uncharacterized protein Pyn_37218 [Prunus yedoensis var. nudiflora]